MSDNSSSCITPLRTGERKAPGAPLRKKTAAKRVHTMFPSAAAAAAIAHPTVMRTPPRQPRKETVLETPKQLPRPLVVPGAPKRTARMRTGGGLRPEQVLERKLRRKVAELNAATDLALRAATLAGRAALSIAMPSVRVNSPSAEHFEPIFDAATVSQLLDVTEHALNQRQQGIAFSTRPPTPASSSFASDEEDELTFTQKFDLNDGSFSQ